MQFQKITTLRVPPFPLLVAALLLVFTSCKTKVDFLTSSVVPAAQGYVTVDTDGNKNYEISIELTGLAEPSRLTPAKTTYVAWIVDTRGNVQNIGQIQTSKRSASLHTVSSFQPTKVFITAEDAAGADYPGLNVLTTETFR